jgi:hypothetical protein
MRFVGYKRFHQKLWKDGNELYFECEWDQKGLDMNSIIAQARMRCGAEIRVEGKPVDSQAESATATVKGKSEDQLRCVWAYLIRNGWQSME